jgi:hypothetical protein
MSKNWAGNPNSPLRIGLRLKSIVPVTNASPRNAPRINIPDTAVTIKNLVAA